MDEISGSDSRVQCKYGASCYQKNEAHLKKFKHDKKASPDKKAEPELVSSSSSQKNREIENQRSGESASESPPNKKQKTETAAENPKLEESPSTQNIIDKTDGKNLIKKLFLVDMPDEFYSFWDLCVKLNPKKPLEAFKECNLRLVGPFEVLAGDLTEEKHSVPATLTHWRYFYDPPEFQTLICGDDKKQLHIGYFRDDPNEMPTHAAFNCAAEDCVIKDCGPNLFAAVDFFVASHLKSANPFSKIKIQKLQTSLQNKAKEDNIGLYDKSAFFGRKKKVVCPAFHKAGLVVPFDKKTTVGYRQMETEAKLRKMLDLIAEAETEERQEREMEALDSLITYANIANDECDFGGALELGINMFCHGSEVFHPQIQGILISTYHLLNRSQYAEIIKAHIQSGRKKGTNLSIIV